MDCCSKCPPADYRLHTSPSSMFASGRLPLSMGAGNNGVPIPGAFYNQHQPHHLHATPMRYPHSIYRLSGPGVGSGAGYNVIGPPPPPPAPLSLSSASSVSSNSSVSPPSQSPASPSLYPTYERYGNYGNIPPYVYRGRDAETNGNGFNYANLNHRLDINCYYGRPYDSYNRYAANFAYRNSPSECEMFPGRRGSIGSMGYGNTAYGHPASADLRAVSTPVPGLARYHNYHHGRHAAYEPHPFNYFHMPPSLNRGLLHREPLHPQVNGIAGTPHGSPASSDFNSRLPSDTNTHGSQHIDKVAFNAPETASAASQSANSGSVDCGTNSHMRGLAASNAFPYHQVRPETPLATSRQQHSTDISSPYDVDEEIARKFKERNKFLRRTAAHKTSVPLESPAPPPDRVETPFPASYNNQSSYLQGNHVNQNTFNRMSPYSTGSPYSWTDQYSPKSVRRRPSEASASPTNFIMKNRVLEYDVIPSKKSRKKIKTEDVECAAEMREEIKDITPLPGFQQAFGSTEIGRFSETFLNTPERLDYFYESEPDTHSPQPWETGDSLEGPHYNLHIGATVVQPDAYSENQSSTDSPIENNNFFSEIQCSDY